MKGFRVWSDYWKKYATEAELYMDGSVDAIFEDADGVPHHENTDLVVEFKTGLEDKNGKEIYEGDIVLDDDFGDIGEVEYHAPNFTFHPIYPIERWNSYYIGNYMKVIGNIHENRDLLEEEE